MNKLAEYKTTYYYKELTMKHSLYSEMECKKAGSNMVVKKANGGYACIKVNEL